MKIIYKEQTYLLQISVFIWARVQTDDWGKLKKEKCKKFYMVFNSLEMSSGSLFSGRPRDGNDPELTGRTRGFVPKATSKTKAAPRSWGRQRRKWRRNVTESWFTSHICKYKSVFSRTEYSETSRVIATAAMTSDPIGLDLHLQVSKPPRLHNVFFSFCPSALSYLPLTACSGWSSGFLWSARRQSWY